MPEQPVFSIIIPVFNNYLLTVDCLQSLASHRGTTPFEVIVVDNASSDATPTQIPLLGQQLFADNCVYIRNEENRNFAGACNQGAKAATSEILFFLNNDTQVTPGFAEPLLETLMQENIGAVGPLLLFANTLVQHLGVSIYPDASIQHFYATIPGNHPLAQKRRKLRYITAAALMIRKSDFFFSGRFCEEYINGFEDIELCHRLSKRGLTMTVDPRSVIYHLEQQTRGGAGAHENFRLLWTRCPDIDKPDLHTIAAADGYSLSLSLFFESMLQPEPKRLAALNKECATGSTQRCLDLIRQEIFWEEGYRNLAKRLAASGDKGTAASLMASCCNFFPTLENLRATLPLLEQTGKIAVSEAIKSKLVFKEGLLKTPERFANSFAALQQTANNSEDPALHAIVAAWEQQHGAIIPKKAH